MRAGVFIAIVLILSGCGQTAPSQHGSVNSVKLPPGQKFGYKPPSP